MLSIEMFPARHGDCLWLTYGAGDDLHHVLIDGGYPSTADLVRARLAADPKLRLDLMILTHIDEDHIYGGIQLLASEVITADRIDDVWFNGWQHLVDIPEEGDELGAKQGEYFSALLEKKKLPWNKAFGNGPVLVPHDRPPPRVELAGGMQLTLLSPTAPKLHALRKKWKQELAALKGNKLTPGDLEAAFAALLDDSRYDTDELGDIDVDKLAAAAFKDEDSGAPNGSSIAVLAEYGGKRLLLTGDAHPSVLAETLERLGHTEDDRLRVDVLKLSHHGSKNNTSPELLSRLDYRDVLISTNGDKFKHPDDQALARVVHGRNGVALHFNYLTDRTRPWLDPAAQKKWRYTADHGEDGTYLLTVA